MKRYFLAEDTINSEDIQELIAWLQTNPWLTQGPLVNKLQDLWSQWLGISHSVFVNSGSSANLLMFYALLLSEKLKNKKVVVPAVSWATTVAPAIQLGFEPIMCEADPKTFGLDLNHLETILKTENPGSVIAVHVLGVPCDLKGLMEMKTRYEFLLMEDSCAATGSSYQGKKVGTFGDVSTFSFFFGHHISTIEGGMVCTQDSGINEILLSIRSHGWAKDLPKERQNQMAEEAGALEFNQSFTFYYPGFNVRSTDLNARIGISQMGKIDQVVKRRVENHKLYQSKFAGVPGFQYAVNPEAEISSIAFSLLASSIAHRSQIVEGLRQTGVETRPLGGGNMSRQPFWKKHFPSCDFPVADRIRDTCFQLPNHPGLSQEDIHFICDSILSYAEHSSTRA